MPIIQPVPIRLNTVLSPTTWKASKRSWLTAVWLNSKMILTRNRQRTTGSPRLRESVCPSSRTKKRLSIKHNLNPGATEAAITLRGFAITAGLIWPVFWQARKGRWLFLQRLRSGPSRYRRRKVCCSLSLTVLRKWHRRCRL